MDYSKLSDAEINQSVTSILNPDAGKMTLSADGSCFYDCGPDGSQFYEVPIPDYCNNPADAWPIITENMIALKPVKLFVGGHRWFASKGDSEFAEKVSDENPLRAAMICYLMIQESE